MLSYSACSDFYKCPYLFQIRDDLKGYTTPAMTVGAGFDTMMNAVMLSMHKDKDFAKQRGIELGISEMLMKIADAGDVCEMFDIPRAAKEWFIDFKLSELEVVDVQHHFILDELDFHGYIDGIVKDKDGNLIVIENKTTSKFYDGYFSNKKNSYQGISYAVAMNTNLVRYQFFNTKNMIEYATASRFITPEDVDEFTKWVAFVRDNQKVDVKNFEYCSLNNCFGKDMCIYERDSVS